jgi:hypothetical protein
MSSRGIAALEFQSYFYVGGVRRYGSHHSLEVLHKRLKKLWHHDTLYLHIIWFDPASVPDPLTPHVKDRNQTNSDAYRISSESTISSATLCRTQLKRCSLGVCVLDPHASMHMFVRCVR